MGSTKENCRSNDGRFKKQTNTYNLDGEYGVGYTLKGEEFWFDLEDYDLIKSYCWHYSNKGYVQTNDPTTRKTVKLHRLILGIIDPKIQVDHRNHPPRNDYKKDNRKSNLKIVTQSENSQNRSLASNNTSGSVGVSWDKKSNAWKSYIKINQKMIHLGFFDDKNDAIQARKNAELKYFGDNRYDANN